MDQAFQIILVEDNPDDAILTIRAFKSKNLDQYIIHLKNGEEALDFFFNKTTNNGHLFTDSITTIILLDINMPKVDGLQVLKALKSSDFSKHIPVVMLTSSTDDPVIEKCKELGADDYIIKPVTLEGFKEVVVKLIPYWAKMLPL
jgi:two-component system response regulator